MTVEPVEPQDGDELTPAQRDDLKKRLEEHRADKSNPIPWDEFRKQLLKKQ